MRIFGLRATILILISAQMLSAQVFAYSLQEALQTAFDRNKRTTANLLRVEASQERVRAAWLDMLPSADLYVSSTRRDFTNTSGDQVKTGGDSVINVISYGVTANLFRGGADYYAALAAEAQKNAQEALYNSTNALIPNTKGAIANLVAQSFFLILERTEAINAFEIKKNQLLKLKTATSKNSELDEINRSLLTISAGQERLRLEKKSFDRDFEFAVTVPPPNDLDNIESVIQSLEVPPNYDEALSVALVSSPELIASKYQLEEIQNAREAQARRIYSPSVDLIVYKNSGTSYINGVMQNNAADTTIGVSLSWSFAPRSSAGLSALDKQVEASRSDYDAAQSELRHDLGQTYENLHSRIQLLEQYRQNLNLIDRSVEQLMSDIDAHKPVDFVLAMKLINDRFDTFNTALDLKVGIAFTKFHTQKIIGTLFETTNKVYMQQLKRPSP